MHICIRTIILLLLLSGQLAFPVSAQRKNTANARPNILWITCEDMSAHLPSFGDSTIVTPNLDKLAKQSIRYTRMFSTSGVCAPSRSAIITGMYPSSIGTNHMRTGQASRTERAHLIDYEAVPPPEVKCFPEYLRAAGYYCTNNAKTDYQIGNPFTVWDESSNQAHWRNRPKDQPFFAVFNIMRTHESQIWEHKDKPLRVDPATVKLPPYYPNTPTVRRDMARYYDNILVMDSLAGVILQQLEEDGLLENTIVFYFSDHGAGLPWYKRELYDRGLHVPLMVRFPDGRGAGTTNNELLSFVDLAPTVLSLAGIPIPQHIQGQAFLGDQQAHTPRRHIFAARDRMDEFYDMVRAVRDTQFKYIRNFQPDKPNYQDIPYRRQMDMMQEILQLKEAGKLTGIPHRWFESKPVEELYDILNDPFELTNLAADPVYHSRLKDMRTVLDAWLIDTRDKGFMSENDLLELMWPGYKQPLTAVPVIHVQGGNSRKKSNLLVIECPTEGASIAYKVEGQHPEWQLYTGPITLTKSKVITAKAIRYGYQASEEAKYVPQ